MITKAKVTSGFAASLSALKDREFIFTPGTNVIFGPNGCGKSTLLGILAAYSSVPANGIESEMGWSRVPSGISLSLRGDVKFPEAFSGLAPGSCGADVEWDGTPTMYHHTAISDQRRAYIGETDGVLSTLDEMNILMGHPSSGQHRLFRFRKVMDALKTPPDLTQPKDSKRGQSSIEKVFIPYVESLPRSGPCTLILDEPERSLSTEMHEQFWLQVVPHFSKTHQIIIATHSVYSFLLLGEANFIDMVEGKMKRSQAGVLTIADIIRSTSKPTTESEATDATQNETTEKPRSEADRGGKTGD